MLEQWPVRIFDEGNPESGGSGFLIDARRVLTCAHVVEELGTPTVRFPMRLDVKDMPATVDVASRWSESGDGTGDLAVLTLPHDVPVAPVRFAARNAYYARRPLSAVGFPLVAGDIGKIATAAAPRPRMLHRGEWVQLDSADGFGPAVGRGYSGGAVMIAETSEIVGMVVQADKSDRTGLMLPIPQILAHRPDLLDLVPLGPLDAGVHGELRRLLADVEVPNPGRIFHAAIGDDLRPYRPEDTSASRPHSAYAIARHIAEEAFGEAAPEMVLDRLARLCGLLADDVTDPERQTSLRRWRIAHAPAATVSPAAPAESLPAGRGSYRVSVRVARSAADRRLVLLDIVVERPDCTSDVVYSHRKNAAEVQGVVEEQLPTIIDRHVPPTADLLVEFVLPRPWLAKNVDEWRLGRRSEVRIGWRHPVVVRDRARFDERADDRERRRRWAALTGAQDAAGLVTWVGCQEAVTAGQMAIDLAKNAGRAILAFASVPRPVAAHPAIRAGFDSGVPVMLWRRVPCDNACAGPCAGSIFRAEVDRQLADHLAAHPVHQLPELVRRLRLGDGDTAAPESITLLWDVPQDRNPPRKLAMAGNAT